MSSRDIEKMLKREQAEQKVIARSASCRASRRKGFKGGVVTAVDMLKGKEKREYMNNSEVSAYNMYDNIMKYDRYRKMGHDIRKKALGRYLENYKISEIAEQMEAMPKLIINDMDRYGLKMKLPVEATGTSWAVSGEEYNKLTMDKKRELLDEYDAIARVYETRYGKEYNKLTMDKKRELLGEYDAIAEVYGARYGKEYRGKRKDSEGRKIMERYRDEIIPLREFNMLSKEDKKELMTNYLIRGSVNDITDAWKSNNKAVRGIAYRLGILMRDIRETKRSLLADGAKLEPIGSKGEEEEYMEVAVEKVGRAVKPVKAVQQKGRYNIKIDGSMDSSTLESLLEVIIKRVAGNGNYDVSINVEEV